MDKNNSKSDEWIRMASKSHPGRYYMFNTSTGERQWISRKNEGELNAASKKQSPAKMPLPRPVKTPAQDRLKRLQHQIKLEQHKKESQKMTRHPATDLKPTKESQKQLTHLLPELPGCSENAGKAKKLKRPAHEKGSDDCIGDREESSEDISPNKLLRLDEDSQFKLKLNNRNPANKSNDSPATKIKYKEAKKRKHDANVMLNNEKKSNAAGEPIACDSNDNLLNKAVSKTSSILEKLKDICSTTFFPAKDDTAKAVKTKKSLKRLKESDRLNKVEVSVPGQEAMKTDKSNDILTTPKKSGSGGKLSQNATNFIYDTFNFDVNSTPKDTANSGSNLNIPSYEKGSANSRLARLRQSLKQQASTNEFPSTPVSHLSSTSLPALSSTMLNTPVNTLYVTANDDEIEAMDWQDDNAEDAETKSPPTTDIFLTPKATQTSYLNISRTRSAETMGDIYDTVNNNLLRMSAEKKTQQNERKWLKDHYYFVVDTNVLIDYLVFIEELSRMKLCDTQGSIIFVPYAVLQELDRLKMRSGRQEGVKTMAVRSIKYLNNKFESNTGNLQAQTASEERQHLIAIGSADDSIINCCLQVQQQIPNVVLLSEDVNLRNKAICNDIIVTTKSDLMHKSFTDDSFKKS